jgi:hypothetical protein
MAGVAGVKRPAAASGAAEQPPTVISTRLVLIAEARSGRSILFSVVTSHSGGALLNRG